MHTLKLANFKGSKGHRTLWLWLAGHEKLTGLSLPSLYLVLSLLCVSLPLSLWYLLFVRPHPPVLSISTRPNLQPNYTFPIFFQCLPLSPGEDWGRMELWLSWYILDNKSRMAIILFSLLYARVPQPLYPTPHALFLSALGSLDTDTRNIWKDDGWETAREGVKEALKYVKTVSFSSLCLISFLTAALFHLEIGDILEEGADMVKLWYHLTKPLSVFLPISFSALAPLLMVSVFIQHPAHQGWSSF